MCIVLSGVHCVSGIYCLVYSGDNISESCEMFYLIFCFLRFSFLFLFFRGRKGGVPPPNPLLNIVSLSLYPSMQVLVKD